MAKDCNGREIRVGDCVIHCEADSITDWGRPKIDWPKRADGTTPLCVPFQGAETVIRVGKQTVALGPHVSRIPVFLSCMVEVQ